MNGTGEITTKNKNHYIGQFKNDKLRGGIYLSDRNIKEVLMITYFMVR